MAEYKLEAQKREISTKGYLNKLRKEGKIPAVFYLKSEEPIHIICEENRINPLIFTSETHVVSLIVDGAEPVSCILKDVQFDPVSDRVIHADFYGITAGELIEIEVPVNLIGQAAGVKEGGNLVQNLHKLNVECMPRHIPQHIELDVTELTVGKSILVGDLDIENLNILNPADAMVVTVTQLREEEEEVEDDGLLSEEPAEPEVISKGKTEEE